MHINRLFLFASFVIIHSFFRLFVQYDYHINQCNTSPLNKHRIIYKIMRASLIQQDGQDTDRTQHHSHRQHRPQPPQCRRTDRGCADHVHHSTDRAEHTHNQALQQWRAGWSAGHGRSRAQTQRSRQISRQNKKKQTIISLLFFVCSVFGRCVSIYLHTVITDGVQVQRLRHRP